MTLIVTVARHVEARLQELGFNQTTTIENPVDVERFCPRGKDTRLLRELSIDDDRVVMLHVSKLAAVKRPLDIVAAARIAVRQDPRIVCVVIGEGAALIDMKKRCRDGQLSDYFRFAPWVAHQDVASYMNIADIVVMPSESEGQSLVCLEAQACGRLVLASDIPGAREIIKDGETGILFGVGSVSEFAEKMLHAARHPELRSLIGSSAREAVLIHSHVHVARRYSDAMRPLISRSGVGRHRVAGRL
jgi:glycosyltransferase involved in cell wall biosynthesis